MCRLDSKLEVPLQQWNEKLSKFEPICSLTMLIKKIRVAVYCRVSTPHEDQVKSLSNQISYYKAMVNNRVNWELVDIYADVQSGKNTSGRPEFQRMLEDCRNHKIDMIITKSISRFGYY
ncbi:recombinase family protein [Peptoclostridium acidaminophilum]|nr:recombinase family protein [Peptoclostridium acidaminophilum]